MLFRIFRWAGLPLRLVLATIMTVCMAMLTFVGVMVAPKTALQDMVGDVPPLWRWMWNPDEYEMGAW